MFFWKWDSFGCVSHISDARCEKEQVSVEREGGGGGGATGEMKGEVGGGPWVR